MRKPKIYLETTMFNYYFDTEREAHASTVKLFEEIKAGKYDAFTSFYVTDEIEMASNPKKSNMLALIDKYNIKILKASEEARQLADIYVNESVIPVKYRYDGLHIAVATVNNMQYIFSLNFRHINKLKTKAMTGIINIREGYSPITIASPMEV
ncbi:MAG: PIN domain-containing protein [Defluviitaleaceae bacterium]|nr:PIN domain-containing protein [Defluviitaleaceae bacterium]